MAHSCIHPFRFYQKENKTNLPESKTPVFVNSGCFTAPTQGEPGLWLLLNFNSNKMEKMVVLYASHHGTTGKVAVMLSDQAESDGFCFAFPPL
jgi:hypothetical protein